VAVVVVKLSEVPVRVELPMRVDDWTLFRVATDLRMSVRLEEFIILTDMVDG
jgi:hypothetical protein